MTAFPAFPMPYMTNREREVLGHVSKGWSSKQVALLIGAAPRTVESHIANLKIKLGAKNSSHMILLAFQCGALDGPAD
ncbi:helix-turn-helix transcriptional regulator [Allosphingosinicella flava]|uniref:Helix-turn-helix transcriptional regulator n=1 Tax=Allosphingosinicella flava TaxID=2771430 RepID=A0A7T2GI17_9SPHN|nr:helix-turn-helix transcriptional regulator [Sphingosinicella flava]QPQ54238.1 helix-turn-helix transcriptional regulator [Sphingosinicella flava]